jgi:hypothetical protein
MTREIILPEKLKEVLGEWEDSLVKTWRTCIPIAPKMLLDFKVAMMEIYASTVGQVLIRTPFWRGKKFTDAITRHEFLHYSIYPLDIFRGISDLTLARKMLKEEISPQAFKEYTIQELQFISNVLGDYLIHLQMMEKNKDEWVELWDHLVEGGKFQAEKIKDRDTAFQLYISAYHWMNEDVPEFKINDKGTKDKAKKVADIVLESRKGIVSKPFAIKELARLFHDHIKEDEKEAEKNKKDEEPKCPKCNTNDWEIVEILEKEDNESI